MFYQQCILIAVSILSSCTRCWPNIGWELPAPETEFLLSGSSVFQAQPSTQTKGETTTAFLPGTGFQPWGSALILGTHNWFQASHVARVVLWRRSPSAILLKGLAPFQSCPCNCGSVTHPGLFCSGWALVRSAFGAGSPAVFWSLLPPGLGISSVWHYQTLGRIFNTGALF